MKYLIDIGKNSKIASYQLKKANNKIINKVLLSYCKKLKTYKRQILNQNEKDIKLSKKSKLLDRLRLNNNRIEGIRNAINEIIKFKSPVGQVLEKWKRPNKLIISRVSIPIGVIGVIYESRPNVTADVAALCLKSCNSVILRGGSEAFNSNKILADLFRQSLHQNRLNKNAVQFIEKKDRKIVDQLLSKMSKYVDVIVPRGGKGLVDKVQKYSRVHVIGHLEGLCHIYLEKSANLNHSKKIILNAKMRRTSICGAVETLLIEDKAIKSHGVPIIKSLIDIGCEVLVDKKINRYFENRLKFAKELDWQTEYLDAKISIKSVKNVKEAVSHILNYGTMHTDSIITNNKSNANFFLNSVNSSIAMHNVSTQFADGGEFGFGGEVGISTNKLPPRGPVGINQLTSYKYIVSGNNIIRK